MFRSSFLVVLLIFAVAKGEISNNCLACICQVESNCKLNYGCQPDPVDLACGPYQIHEDYWKDCGKPGSSYRSCANDKYCSERCVRKYMDRYAESCTTRTPNCETFARIHNGGPSGCRVAATIGYWKKVDQCCKGKWGGC